MFNSKYKFNKTRILLIDLQLAEVVSFIESIRLIRTHENV